MLVNTHGHVNRFRAVLVAYKDAVLSRIFHVDIVYSDAAALGRLSDYKVILAEYLPIVTKPEDLWGWFAINVARQTQRLKRRSKQDMKWQVTERSTYTQDLNSYCTLPSIMATTSGRPFVTLARSETKRQK